MLNPWSPTSLTVLLSLVLCALPPSSASPVPTAPANTPSHRPFTPPQRLFSSNTNSTFKALPPMPNPNRPIWRTDPAFEPILAPKPPGREMKNRTDEAWSTNRTLPAITHVDKENGMFYDEDGKVRMFRGMAVSYKVSPFVPNVDNFDPVMSFAEDDLRLFDKLNLNVMRLGISWAAVQPQKGEHGFDLAYLDKTRRMVEKAAEAGIYVVIECHQDLFAEKFMGDGMPSWAITRDWNTLPFPMPIHGLSMAKYDSLAHVDSAPINMKYSDFWGFEYGADAVTRAFWGLYTNYDGVQTEFIRFWGKLAETFSGMSNVLGYEIMNEPFIAARSTLHVPLAWLTRGRTDTYYLQPMYDRVEAAIRQHDDRSLIFWEPVCGSGGDLGAGFSKTPGDKPEKSVFSFHSYGPNAIDTLNMETAIQKGVHTAHRLGGAAMMTEWDVEYVQGPRRLRKVLELADDVRLSWIGWQYKQFVRVAGSPPYGTLVDPRTGVYRPGMCKLFSRPYPSAVYGDLLGFNFNWTTSELTVRVAPPKDGEAEVVISVTEEDEWGWDGSWRLQHVAKADGERIGSVRVEKEKDLKKGGGGVRWWVEKAWVEGSKFVKIRLGEGWEGEATIVVGLEPSAELEKDQTVVIQEWNEKHAEWNATADDAWSLGM